MPDLPPRKAHPHPAKAKPSLVPEDSAATLPQGGAAVQVARYAELHVVSNFTFQRGASHPDELVQRATELGSHALAITAEASLAGVVRAHVAAKATTPAPGLPPRLKLIVGTEIHLEDAASVVLLATDRPSYGRLSRLITLGRRRAEKG